jgi:hypothetical protein
VCIAAVSGCGTMKELRENAVKETKAKFDTQFAAQDGRLGEAEMRACLANQLNKPDGSAFLGKPEFKPNYFLTCAANFNASLGSLSQVGVSGHILVYRVSVETNNIPPGAAAMQAVGAQSKWFAQFDCAYVVKDDKIEAFKEERYGILFSVKAVPSQIQQNHFCLDMPESGAYIRGNPPGVWR